MVEWIFIIMPIVFIVFMIWLIWSGRKEIERLKTKKHRRR